MTPISLTRRVSFSSGHRYWLPELSALENRELFGPWASPYNHGHNYVLDMTCRGTVNPDHGMVINIKVIDDILKERVLRVFDQKSINDEVPSFGHKSPSTENLLLHFARVLHNLPSEAELTELTLFETPLLYGGWSAAEPTMVTLTRVYEFAASHRLHAPHLSHIENIDLFGKCNNPNGHGHNYVLEVTIKGIPDEHTGMIADLGTLDEMVEKLVIDRYDHKNLDLDLPELEGKNTTSEVVALAIFERLRGRLPAELVRVKLHETARNCFTVEG